ncbi:MAG: bile acid:sodium symporter family protein [Phyllobacteriaceae bacterium]|nr:bile acid:sodium symporter family protein [Phyllobacteriaceae bacterium]
MSAMLPLGLAFLMFVVGLRLTPAGLGRVIFAPKALAAGLTVQMLLLPILAYLIASTLRLSPVSTTGLMVIAAAPGGITSNYVALAARADVALSTAMTLVTSLAACLSIPLVLAISGVGAFGETGITGLVRISLVMFAVTALPLSVGLAMRRYLPGLAARWESPLDRAATIVFASIVLATLWQNRAAMLDHLPTIGPAALLLNVAAIGAGLSAGAITGLRPEQGLAIAVESGLQNVAMAIFVATAMLGQSELSAPALVYAVLMNVSAVGLIWFGRGRTATTPFELPRV